MLDGVIVEDGIIYIKFQDFETDEYGYAVSKLSKDLKRKRRRKIVIPQKINGLPVNKIGKEAFVGASFREIYLPDTIVEIEEAAFASSCIETINLPSSLEVIGERAFFKCIYLREITFNAISMRRFGLSAFCECLGLQKVNISENCYWENIVFENEYSNPLFYSQKLYKNNKLITTLHRNSCLVCEDENTYVINMSSRFAFINCEFDNIIIDEDIFLHSDCFKMVHCKNLKFFNDSKLIGDGGEFFDDAVVDNLIINGENYCPPDFSADTLQFIGIYKFPF